MNRNTTLWALALFALTLAACVGAPAELNQQLADAVVALVDTSAALKEATQAALADPSPDNVAAVAELAAREVELAQVAAELRQQVADYGGGVDWSQVGAVIGTIAASVTAAITGVRITRGPAKPLAKAEAQTLKDLVAAERVRRSGTHDPV